MNDLLELWEEPITKEAYLVAGWHQWADAGSISSGLPEYLIDQTGARKIGQIKPEGFYLFQIPGTHHFLRPEIKLEEGYPQELRIQKNEIFYSGDEDKGLFIFLGDEPHLNAAQYGAVFFEMVERLGIKRIAGVGGVYASTPYDKDRDVSCAYSLQPMKQELTNYAVRFSNYEGGATIGSYLLKEAERRALEFCVFYAFVPAYDFSETSNSMLDGLRIDQDYKAWYDLMRRINHLFELQLALSDLEQKSEDLTESMETKIKELEQKMPQLNIREYLAQVASQFTETPFMPLDDVWERELGDLFDGMEEE